MPSCQHRFALEVAFSSGANIDCPWTGEASQNGS